jgi:hypothetical protein
MSGRGHGKIDTPGPFEFEVRTKSPSPVRLGSPAQSFKSIAREGRDEASNRDSEEVLTNPHPWENDVDSRTGTEITIENDQGRPATVITIGETSSKSGSDTSIKDTDSDNGSSDAWDISSLPPPDNTLWLEPRRFETYGAIKTSIEREMRALHTPHSFKSPKPGQT